MLQGPSSKTSTLKLLTSTLKSRSVWHDCKPIYLPDFVDTWPLGFRLEPGCRLLQCKQFKGAYRQGLHRQTAE